MSRKKEFRNCFYNKCGVFLVYLFAYKTCPSTLISSVYYPTNSQFSSHTPSPLLTIKLTLPWRFILLSEEPFQYFYHIDSDFSVTLLIIILICFQNSHSIGFYFLNDMC
uniref:Uncharacterized protein LOC113789200 n=1 Tax=Dermatophagoides pteronyssinus TaxID=6956 RepID=A0A6P6XM47_DERPT|nr:uncharacterized protein LOC113789200 [Dermatophagoides pteronyssinus]